MEYSLNHISDLTVIEGIFLNEGILESLGTLLNATSGSLKTDLTQSGLTRPPGVPLILHPRPAPTASPRRGLGHRLGYIGFTGRVALGLTVRVVFSCF